MKSRWGFDGWLIGALLALSAIGSIFIHSAVFFGRRMLRRILLTREVNSRAHLIMLILRSRGKQPFTMFYVIN